MMMPGETAMPLILCINAGLLLVGRVCGCVLVRVDPDMVAWATQSWFCGLQWRRASLVRILGSHAACGDRLIHTDQIPTADHSGTRISVRKTLVLVHTRLIHHVIDHAYRHSAMAEAIGGSYQANV